MSIAPGMIVVDRQQLAERHVLAERHEMRLVVDGADRAGAVDRLDAVPDLRHRLGRRVGPHRAGDDVAALRRDCAAIAARCRASRSSRKGAAASGHITAASVCVDGRTAEFDQAAEIGLGGGRVPFEPLRDRGLHEAQPCIGRPRRQQAEPDRAGRRRHQDQQRGGDRRSGAPRRAASAAATCRRAAPAARPPARSGSSARKCRPRRCSAASPARPGNRPTRHSRPGSTETRSGHGRAAIRPRSTATANRQTRAAGASRSRRAAVGGQRRAPRRKTAPESAGRPSTANGTAHQNRAISTNSAAAIQ